MSKPPRKFTTMDQLCCDHWKSDTDILVKKRNPNIFFISQSHNFGVNMIFSGSSGLPMPPTWFFTIHILFAQFTFYAFASFLFFYGYGFAYRTVILVLQEFCFPN